MVTEVLVASCSISSVSCQLLSSRTLPENTRLFTHQFFEQGAVLKLCLKERFAEVFERDDSTFSELGL